MTSHIAIVSLIMTPVLRVAWYILTTVLYLGAVAGIAKTVHERLGAPRSLAKTCLLIGLNLGLAVTPWALATIRDSKPARFIYPSFREEQRASLPSSGTD